MKKLLLCLCLGACEFDYDYGYDVDLRLVPYVNGFYDEAAIRGIALHRNLTARVEPLAPLTEGKATTRGKQSIVIISSSSYADYRDTTNFKGDTLYYIVEALVFHELGHALLDRQHCHNACYSLMQERVPRWYAFDRSQREPLLNELFGKEIEHAN